MEADSGEHGVDRAAGSLAKFGGEAHSASIDVTRHGYHGDTAGVAVEFGKLAEVEVAEALVPEHAEGGPCQAVDSKSKGSSRRELREVVERFEWVGSKGRGGREM